MFKYRWMSRMQWLLNNVDEQTIARAWSRVRRESPEALDEQIADKVEDYFGIRNLLQTNPS